MGYEPKIQILLATYNGEKFLKKQLDSIVNQKYSNWKLLIRDDGSNDNTIAIINEYCKKDSRINLIINKTNIHGWQQNFQKLMESADLSCDYFMFCDHDDIWFENKIKDFAVEIIKAEKGNKSLPVVVYADMQIIDADDNVTSNSFNSIFDIEIKRPLDSFFSQRVYGCNMMFNNILMKKCNALLHGEILKKLSHDGYVVKAAAALGGKIIYLKKPYMQYRRFGSNATAKQDFDISTKRIVKALAKFDRLALYQTTAYVQSLWVIDLFEETGIRPACPEALADIKNAINKGGFYALKVWIKYKTDCGRTIRTLSHLLVLFTCRHKQYLEKYGVR